MQQQILRILLPVLFFTALKGAAQSGEPVDPDFRTGNGFRRSVDAIALQPDGKIIAGGSFSQYEDNEGLNLLARLHPDGRLDESFRTDSLTGSTFNRVYALALQPDGKILAGGEFTAHGTDSAYCLIRLNADGSRDETFDIGSGFRKSDNTGGRVSAIIVLGDGKIIAGGNFNTFDGRTAESIVRLNADGSFDNTYNTGNGFQNREVWCLRLLPDNKLLVGGNFERFNGNRIKAGLTRLLPDGQIDNSFDQTGGAANVWTIFVQPDGRLMAGGNFLGFNGRDYRRLVRLHADGTTDTTFRQEGTGFNNSVWSVVRLPDGRYVAGGLFSSYDDKKPPHLLMLDSNGNRMTSVFGNFAPGNAVQDMIVQEDGKLLVAGLFLDYTGVLPNPQTIRRAGGIIRLVYDKSMEINTSAATTATDIRIFPNPASDRVYIMPSGGTAISGHVRINDLNGRTVLLETTGIRHPVGVRVGHLPRGIYFLTAEDVTGRSVHRLVLQ